MKLTREETLKVIKSAREKDESTMYYWGDPSTLDLRGLDFSMEDLSGADFGGVDLREANFSKANLSDARFTGADLKRANLSKAELRLTNLHSANLDGANLSGANLTLAFFSDANLSRADLSEAVLDRTVLRRADLYQTSLSGTKIVNTDLVDANLGGAILRFTVFVDVDLSKVRGLDSVGHLGPSYIDINTIYCSKDKIPESFLRGVGVSDTFITYIGSLTREAFQYYSCFISYSSQDEAFAQRLHADLQQKGVRCWFAPEDMKIGDKIRPAIDQSIRIHDKLLIILSENSLNSFWVESEVEKAFEEERQRGQTVLFPVRLDEVVMETEESWAAEIRRTRHIGDFSRWKDHDVYQQAFERLLRDLKAEG